MKFLLTAVLSLALVPEALAKGASAPTVDLGYVRYKGQHDSEAKVNVFRGIRYAHAPTGELRFRAPHPIDKNRKKHKGEPLDATKTPKKCPQAATTWNKKQPTDYDSWDENCLRLTITTPEKANNHSKLPVVVQIHGGGFIEGTFEPGEGLVSKSKGSIIHVAMQYRLGMFGFLAGDEVGKDGDKNAGILDQWEALQWVQRHIDKFGGDAGKVTVWGGSAGGVSVTHMLTAYGGTKKAPFKAAIPEFPGWHPMFNETTQNAQFKNILGVSGCDSLKCLRGLDSKKLMKVNQDALVKAYPSPGYNYGLFYYHSVVDGKIVPDLLSELLKKGKRYHVPVLTTHDMYEGVAFTDPKLESQKEETKDAKHLFQDGGAKVLQKLYNLYPRSGFNSTFFQRAQWYGDLLYACPTRFIARTMPGKQVHKLLFDAGSQLHAATGAFLNSADTKFSHANNQTLVDFMTKYWISFVKHHNPNKEKDHRAPVWGDYSANGKGNMLKVTYTTVTNQPDVDNSPQCKFWADMSHETRQ